MGRKIFGLSLGLMTLCALSAAAQPAAKPAEAPCLRVGQIWSFSPVRGNDRALVVEDKSHRRYRITLMRACGGLDFNIGVTIRSHGVGRLSCVARGDDVISRDPGTFNNRCPVSAIELYTPALEQADRAAFAAKKKH